MLIMTESILELQIVVIAMAILVPIILACGIRPYFSSVGIDTHADYSTLAVVGVEGNPRLGVRADIADPHVVKEERRIFQIRLTDDFKISFFHMHRIFSAATLLQLKSGAKVDIKKAPRKRSANSLPILPILCQSSAKVLLRMPKFCV
jgi:hypothetical protein